MRFEYDGNVFLVQLLEPRRPWTAKPLDPPFFLVLTQPQGIREDKAYAATPASATMQVDSVRYGSCQPAEGFTFWLRQNRLPWS